MQSVIKACIVWETFKPRLGLKVFFETPVVKSKSRAHTTVTAIENK